MNEDSVVDNLFIVLQARCNRYECKLLNVKLVKYCNECYGWVTLNVSCGVP